MIVNYYHPFGNNFSESSQSMYCLWPNYSTCRNIWFINTVCFTSAHVSWIWITHSWFINKGMNANIKQKLCRFIRYFFQAKEAGKARIEIKTLRRKRKSHSWANTVVPGLPFSSFFLENQNSVPAPRLFLWWLTLSPISLTRWQFFLPPVLTFVALIQLIAPLRL